MLYTFKSEPFLSDRSDSIRSGKALGAAGRVSIAFTIWACGATVAQAGAWPQPPGTTEVIATAASKRYNSRPEKEFDIYAEHGVSKTWTAIAGVRGWSRLDSARTFSQVGVRRALKPILGAEIASEARVLHGRDWNECGGWGLESRALAGKNVDLMGLPLFLDVAVAARSFSDGCAEGRLEATLGSLKDRGPGFLLQANAERIIGGFEIGAATARGQTQVSIVYGLGSGLKIQAGVRGGFENTGKREQAVLVGIWRKF